MNIIKTGLIAVMLISASQTFAQQLSFSGNWNYNKELSDLKSYPTYAFPVQLQVSMTADSIFIRAIVNGPNGTTMPSALAKYALDGKQIEKAYPGDVKRITSYQFSNDNKSIIKNSRTTKAGAMTITVKEGWFLSDNGKVLTITLTEEDANKTPYSVKGIFEKQ